MLLEAALEQLQLENAPTKLPDTQPSDTPAPQPPQHPLSDSLGISELLKVLQPDPVPQGEVPNDPFCFGTGPFSAKKLRHVVDYITHLGPSQQEDTKVTIAGVDVAVAKAKLSIDKINHAQYIEGSLRILREMILQDSLPTQQVVNHVNYLIQVACLAQTNQWQRVLQYDTYRKEQHEHGFLLLRK